MNAFETRVASAKREIRARAWDGIERRTIVATVEARDLTEGGWQIAGQGIVYDRMSEDLGGFREVVQPGAAASVLAQSPDVRGLFNHNPDLILGRTQAGTMTLTEDAGGTNYLINAPATSYANDLRVSMERGDVTQSSFAFRVNGDGVIWLEDPETGALIRQIHEFSGLYDMSPVTYPAYPQTSSGVAEHSFAHSDERNGDGLSLEERAGDGDTVEAEADDAAWKRGDKAMRMRLREAAEKHGLSL